MTGGHNDTRAAVRWQTWLGATMLVSSLVVGACSLGDGVTPQCDPTLAPGEAGACRQVAACDQGNGAVIPSEECCDVAATRQLEVCERTNELSGSFIELCVGSAPSDCCSQIQPLFDACRAGSLSTGSGGAGGTGGAGGGGGAGGVGGAGGAGGAGGMAGSGGTAGAGGN